MLYYTILSAKNVIVNDLEDTKEYFVMYSQVFTNRDTKKNKSINNSKRIIHSLAVVVKNEGCVMGYLEGKYRAVSRLSVLYNQAEGKHGDSCHVILST